MTLSPDGSVAYVAGEALSNTGAYVEAAGYDTATGATVWSARYDGRNSNSCIAVAVSPDGSQMILAGASQWKYPNDYPVMTTVAFSAGS